MMKFAGYNLISSFTPTHSIIVKSPRRFPLRNFSGNSAKLRNISAYIPTHQLHAKTPKVAADCYFPPLFSVAPMMDWTDHHYRTLARLISKHAWLYTEMLAVDTIVHQKDNLDRFLAFSPEQHPIVLQIGGSNLKHIAEATELANLYGYDEINFNCGCPSPKVAGHGCFGVRLMLDPKFVGEAMSAIASNTNSPVTVKCRIGVDDHDSYDELCDFIYKVSSLSPTRHFIIHSRKALLNGISPADNRKIPPLKYEYYFALLRDFPGLKFTINGGINSVDEVISSCLSVIPRCLYPKERREGRKIRFNLLKIKSNFSHLLGLNKQYNVSVSPVFNGHIQVKAALHEGAHGVMVGRAAYNNPWSLLGHVDTAVYGMPSSGLTRREVLEKYQVYGDSVLWRDGKKPNVRDVVKPLLGLFHSEPGNGLWKRKADAAFRTCTTVKSFFEETINAIPDFVLDAPISGPPPESENPFAGLQDILPPPYDAKEEELMYA